MPAPDVTYDTLKPFELEGADHEEPDASDVTDVAANDVVAEEEQGQSLDPLEAFQSFADESDEELSRDLPMPAPRHPLVLEVLFRYVDGVPLA